MRVSSGVEWLRWRLGGCLGGGGRQRRKTRRQASFIRRYDASQAGSSSAKPAARASAALAAGPRPAASTTLLPAPTPTLTFLSAKQRKLITNTWDKVEDANELGERIFLHVFWQRRELLALFPFGHVGMESLREEEAFRKQGHMFAVFLQHIVEYVGANDGGKLHSLCVWTGERHAKITHLPFRPDWWQLFLHSTLACVQPLARNHKPTMTAWTLLMEKCVSLMEAAYEAMRHKVRPPPPVLGPGEEGLLLPLSPTSQPSNLIP